MKGIFSTSSFLKNKSMLFIFFILLINDSKEEKLNSKLLSQYLRNLDEVNTISSNEEYKQRYESNLNNTENSTDFNGINRTYFIPSSSSSRLSRKQICAIAIPIGAITLGTIVLAIMLGKCRKNTPPLAMKTDHIGSIPRQTEASTDNLNMGQQSQLPLDKKEEDELKEKKVVVPQVTEQVYPIYPVNKQQPPIPKVNRVFEPLYPLPININAVQKNLYDLETLEIQNNISQISQNNGGQFEPNLENNENESGGEIRQSIVSESKILPPISTSQISEKKVMPPKIFRSINKDVQVLPVIVQPTIDEENQAQSYIANVSKIMKKNNYGDDILVNNSQNVFGPKSDFEAQTQNYMYN